MAGQECASATVVSHAHDLAGLQASWSKGQYTCLPNHIIKRHAKETYVGVEVQLHAPDGGHWTA
jgi:hypothetical protein